VVGRRPSRLHLTARLPYQDPASPSRPRVDPAQLTHIDSLVAAWLPGSEGAGVADPLFGKVPYTGKLPVTWPRTIAQEPINVGDADYDPLYPFGYGLRTR
jgi:beta-glucosidase